MVLNLLMKSLLPITSSSSIAIGNSKITSGLLFPAQRIFGGHMIYDNLVNYVPNRGAARKGKRIQRAREARLRANKRRLLEAQNPKPKKNFKKNVSIDKGLFRFLNERQLELALPNPPDDNVFFMDNFRKKRFSFQEIIKFHRQAVHPDVLNQPDALVSATIELNLKMKIKKKKYIEKIDSTVCYPHVFKYQVKPRKIVALCKREEDQNAAREAGAYAAGGLDVAALLKTNQLTLRDFDHVVCHNDFLEEFAAVKGMKGQPYFPSKQRGNFGDNIVDLLKYFMNGIDYSLMKNPDDQAYGIIDCFFGKLSMTDEQLCENLLTLFNSINRFKPLNIADDKQFFERVMITNPATEEMFLLKFWELMNEYKDPDSIGIEEEKQENSVVTSSK